MRFAPVALVALLVASPAAAQSVREPASGVEFPTTLRAADGSSQQLTGTGIRTRTMLKIKVYAFGLYVDPAAARRALTAFAGKSRQEIQGDANFYTELLRMTLPMSMRLVMTREVGGEQMSEAFDGALRPRVVAAAGRNMPGGEAALDRFRTYFSTDQLTPGTELVFTCANGSLRTTVAGAAKAAIESPALCWALFDVYLGRDPISPDGKRGIVASFPELLAGR